MKLQYKASGLMIFLGIIVLFAFTVFYSFLIKRAVVQKELQSIENLAIELSNYMNAHLEGSISITKSFSSAPLIKNALIKSNSEFAAYPELVRDKKIDTLNARWMETSNIRDPFIQKYLTNPVADFLKLQQSIIPGFYGEIFLTNKYGVMIGATEKLTTLAHRHKYWWQASYFDGKGRIFFDDRGFDDSVGGYVLGVVVPVMKGGNFIGILKSNINIQGPLTDIVHNFKRYHAGNIQIVRTKGLVIAEEDKIPLSSKLPEEFIQKIQTEKPGSEVVKLNNRKVFLAYSPVSLTLGSNKYGFGGKYESIDHIKGNEGEAWYIVITKSESIAMAASNRSTELLIASGIIFIILASLIALLLGKWFASPLVELSAAACKIGEGNLDVRVNIVTDDEIGNLAKSINKMTENLKKVLTSRDKLINEIKLRTIAEEKVSIQLKEKEVLLKETHHRIKNNFASIGSILSLQSLSISNKEAALALEDAAGRVNSMALLYEKLLLEDSYNTASCKQYLESLITDIVNLYSGNIKISVKKQIDDLKLGPKKLFPLGLIVNELLTNVVKYAFEGKDSGVVEIILVENKGKITLTIQDNGRGLPEGFDIDEHAGFGLMLIKMLTQQLNGTFAIDSNKKGTWSFLNFNV